jgi:Domain of unknown function (DUF222)/HNH endonuclease
MFVESRPSPIAREDAGTKSTDELSAVPLELIEREIEELAAHINAGSARWLELVAEFDRRTGWANTGCRSTSEWVAWRCALNPRSAREHVRVARRLPELPLIRECFATGELSYSKVRALTRVADGESEEELLRLARHATAAQLERMVRAARHVTAAEANDLHETSFLRWSWDHDDGSLRIEAKLAPEEGALFLQALEMARDALYEARAAEAEEEGRGSAEPSRPAPPPPPPAPSPTNAESFAALSEAALARPPTGLPGGERYHVFLHVDPTTLATDWPGASLTGPGECSIGGGPGLAPETMRRLACDCSFVPILERDGAPLSVGRRTRSIPPPTRRALVARDGRCQFPGCERHRFVDAHHIVHWAHGGETSLDNLVLLCRHHHRLLHEGGYSLSLDASGRPRFADARGAPIPSSPQPPRSHPSRLLGANRWRGHAIDAHTTLTGSGEKMDFAACVDAVLVATAPAARAAGGPG